MKNHEGICYLLILCKIYLDFYCEIMNGYFHICPLFCAKSIYIFLMQLSCLCSNHEDICTDIFMIFHSVTYIFVQNLFKFFWRNLTVSVQPLSLHSLFCLNEILWDYVPYFVQNLFRFFLCNLTVSVQFEWKIMKISFTYIFCAKSIKIFLTQLNSLCPTSGTS